MPYKNPEDKRRWEQEHRQLRNAQRRQRRLEAQNSSVVQGKKPDPLGENEKANGWGIFIGIGFLVLTIGAGVLGAAASFPDHPVN